jgi:hypothetical protein
MVISNTHCFSQDHATAHIVNNFVTALSNNLCNQYFHPLWSAHSFNLNPCEYYHGEVQETRFIRTIHTQRTNLKTTSKVQYRQFHDKNFKKLPVNVHQLSSISDSWKRSFPAPVITCCELYHRILYILSANHNLTVCWCGRCCYKWDILYMKCTEQNSYLKRWLKSSIHKNTLLTCSLSLSIRDWERFLVHSLQHPKTLTFHLNFLMCFLQTMTAQFTLHTVHQTTNKECLKT